MMKIPTRLRVPVVGLSLLGLGTFTACILLYPPVVSTTHLLVLLTLLALALTSELLALTITRWGTTATMEFVPQLGAILLLGPAYAGFLTLTSVALYQFVLTDRPYYKAVYNLSQVLLAVCAGGLVYLWLGGNPNLRHLDVIGSALPFLAAVIVYFLTNTFSVSFIVSRAQEQTFRESWQQVTGGVFVLDIVMSPLAYLVAYMYTRWGAAALLAALIPIIGLRYSYGVNVELRKLNSDLLRALIKALEAQDPYTSGHSIRVAEGAKRIARELDLSFHKIQIIETAALLHDIGKVGGAYHEILRQETPLTDSQVNLIKQHPERGVNIIRPVRSLSEEVKRYILHHHERYDGTGYPDGLAGDEIPLGARIIMVSDTIDAMRTSRPYRDAKSLDAIREELIDLKGKQFDPDVVDAALNAGILDPDGPIDVETGVAESIGTE